MPERLMTLDEVAEWLQIPKATLYHSRYKGREPASLGFRVGAQIRFRHKDLEDWIEEQAKEARRPKGAANVAG